MAARILTGKQIQSDYLADCDGDVAKAFAELADSHAEALAYICRHKRDVSPDYAQKAPLCGELSGNPG